ncbi:4-amino-4-deoxy-L-arabinose transferase-like glycosyltransferase [Caulobacter ginsengisoli]|uniref:4-amino-4-deoxy-L-arabinose transferase-like glycosyltransferase n=1 Tax=Caulobacter ginsengisoli TaxID=400775 RepID=A0ABU0IXC5_9CAUL|nr:glycosyltransferase family 39 protein [Caulobacter ginsengisoli]MDQ0466640.1 4-amino-4-deoxy-L-arabinose transferase-like glycosyltransferase [Caulobacter ginsengisoli]
MTLESRLDAWSQGWRGPLIAAVVAFLAGLPGAFTMPPMDRDESRFVQATSQMFETGDFVDIRLQDRPRDKKPVGIHWLQAVSVAAFSSVENRDIWPYRIPSLLGAALAAAACAWGAAGFMRSRFALLAGAMLGSSLLLSTEALTAKTDAVLAGAVTLALAAMARLYLSTRGGPPVGWRTKTLFWVGIALGTLVKGPVGPLVALLTGLALWVSAMGGYLWAHRPAKLRAPTGQEFGEFTAAVGSEMAFLRQLGWRWGLLFVLLVCGPWAWAITVSTDGGFWGSAITGDLAPKLAGGHERHGGLFGYHTLIAGILLFPATLLLPAGLVTAWQKRVEPGLRFALCWLIPTWLMFELLPTKLFHYTLPAHGALAWMMAAALREALGTKVRWAGAGLAVFMGSILAIAAVYLMSQFGDPTDTPWTAVTAGLFVLTALIGAYLLLNRAAVTAIVVAGALGVLAHTALFSGLAPRLEPLWVSRGIVRTLDQNGLNPRGGIVPGPVEIAGFNEPSLVFALGTATGLGNGPDAAEAISEGRPAVVDRKQMPSFLAAMAQRGLTPRPVGTFTGKDYTNNHTMVLTFYRGEPVAPAPSRVSP